MRNLAYGNRTCLDAQGGKKGLKKPVSLYGCHRQGGNQVNNGKCYSALVTNLVAKIVWFFCSVNVSSMTITCYFWCAIFFPLPIQICAMFPTKINALLSIHIILHQPSLLSRIKACTTSFRITGHL